MDKIDITVLKALRDWRKAGRHALLATVVRTWGSSPRPVGSTLALREDGAVVGSVSGGCIEDDLIARHAHGDFSGSPELLRYGIDADEAHRFGLPCGGTLELMLEFDPDPAGLSELVEALDAGKLMRRRVALGDGGVSLAETARPEALSLDGQALSATFGPGFRMLLIGAGALSEYLATMAQFSGFAVTVCDPRTEYSGHWSVPGVKMAEGMPDDAVLAFHPDRRSCVIALTHDPKLDDLALLEALQSEAFYVGAIGSRRNNAARRERLAQHFDIPAEALARLRGPIGLYIGSKTPPEIAVSVMAEVLAVKNGVALPAEMAVAVGKEKAPALAA
ncbi:XdhC family protein [Xylophilus rhododendri]|uniref:XdhC family protein n=1 Tax=Xylophilus rhododendri TaxID=2697032 RepID=A0A857JDC1_9BURK|nr:XdhC family protein [Xylophilus rhododendri]QHJ01204.1 XdhC family protein [Xylophilus rhododendri]